MSIVTESGVVSVSWFIPFFVLILVVAVFSKSVLANLALIVVCVLGVEFGRVLADVGEVVRYGLVIMFFCVVGFAIFQLISRVEHI